MEHRTRWTARVVQIQETGEETCLSAFYHGDADVAEDKACAYINNRDLDNQYPESQFVVRLERGVA